MQPFIISILDFIDNRSVIRRIVLFVTLYMTWRAFEWAAMFAEHSGRVGLDVAAIIAAVTAPISALQGYVFKVYGDSRRDG